MITFGMIQYGFYFYASQSGSHTANTLVRQLSVGDCQDSTARQSFVDDSLGAASTGAATVTVSYKNLDGSTPTSPQGANVEIGGTVTATVSFPSVDLNLPFVPFLSDGTVRRTVDARVEDIVDEGC